MSMRKRSLIVVMTGIFLLASFSAYASIPPVGYVVVLEDGVGNTGGGEFKIDVLNWGSSLDFISFCVEVSEYISFRTQYTITGIDKFASNGGAGGSVGGKDYISTATAWLFTQYATGMLDDLTSAGTGTHYLYNDQTSANDLQKAIWYLEDEINYNGKVWGVNNYLAQLALANSNWSGGTGDVWVMNIKDSAGVLKQSQLIYAPVPEPGMLILFGSGLIALAGLRRR